MVSDFNSDLSLLLLILVLLFMDAVMLTRTFHQGPGLGYQGPGQELHSQGPGQGPGFEYKDQDNDKDLNKCGDISVNIPGI